MRRTKLQRAADEYGRIQARIEKLEKRAAKYRAVLADVRHDDTDKVVVDGAIYRAAIAIFERATLDLDAVRACLSAQWLADHTKRSPVTRITVEKL